MNKELPIVYLARHGDTVWSATGQHTGLTDLPLAERGEQVARRLGKRLQGLTFTKVFTSRYRSRALGQRRCLGFFQWSLHPYVRQPLAWP
jgi:bisphosphoglycerate-dependent phosphoglycerate mutase